MPDITAPPRSYAGQVGDTLILVTEAEGGLLAATKPAYDPYARWSAPVRMQPERVAHAVQTDPGATCAHCGTFIPEPTMPMPHDDRPSPWEQYASDVDRHKAGRCVAGPLVSPGAPYVAAPNGGRS